MEQKVKKIPMRQCMGCNEHRPKNELIRVLRTPEGEITIDGSGKRNGRGAYLCPDAGCLAKARRSKRIARVLECELSDAVYDALEGTLTALIAEKRDGNGE